MFIPYKDRKCDHGFPNVKACKECHNAYQREYARHRKSLVTTSLVQDRIEECREIIKRRL